MKCRKSKCSGKGEKTQETFNGLPIYKCQVCGRQWAVGFLPKKKPVKRKD